MQYLELELLAYKLHKKVLNGTILGPQKPDFDHYSTKKNTNLNNKQEGKPLFYSPLFVVKTKYMDKWREVQHYGIAQNHGISINDTIDDSFKTISYSYILDVVTICYGAEVASIRDHKSAFNQVPIDRHQVPKLAFLYNDGLWHTFAFAPLTIQFGRADAPRRYSQYPKSLNLYMIKYKKL